MTTPVAKRSNRREVLLAALLMILGIFGSRVLGLVRVQVQSWWFSPNEVGALRSAFIIPDLLMYIVAGGALRSGFVPVFVGLLSRGQRDGNTAPAWRLFSALVSWVTLLSLAVVVLGTLAAPQLVQLLSGAWSAQGGFSADDRALCLELLRWLLPAQVFLLVGGVLSGTLDAMRRTRLTAWVPCYYNLAIIAAMALFGRHYGVVSAAFGVIVGGFLSNIGWQAWALWREGRPLGINFVWLLDRHDPLLRQVLAISAPVVLGLCVAEIGLRISYLFVAPFGSQAMTWIDNASKLSRLPDGMFGAGLGIALYPYLSHLASEQRWAEYRAQTEQVLRLAILCTVPITAGLVALPGPLVSLLFGYGKYTPADVANTAAMVAALSAGIVGLTLSVIITRAFYARSDSLTPLRGGLWTLAFITLSCWLLSNTLGAIGPAWAYSVACLFNAAWLLVAYARGGNLPNWRRLLRTAAVGHVAAALGAGAAWLALGLPLSRLPLVLISWTILFAVYLGLLWCSRLEELRTAWSMLRRRLRPTALTVGDTEL